MSKAMVVNKGDIESFVADAGGGHYGRYGMVVGAIRGWEWSCLAAIMVVALVLRVVGLNAPLWYDEVVTLTHFVRQPWGSLIQDFSSLNNHMFYSLQAKATLAITGESAWALRAPALIFGMASLPVLWLMARQAAGRHAALIATLLTAVSYHHVWFTQNARGYTGLLFWTGLATYLLAKSLQKPSWKLAIGYAVCVAAGMYTHLSAGFFFLAHGLVYVGAVAIDRVRKQGIPAFPGLRDIRPFIGFLLCGLLTVLLHLPILGQIGGAMGEVSTSTGAGAMNEWKDPWRTLEEVVGSLGPLGPVAPIAFVGGIGLVIIGAGAILRRNAMLGAIYLLHIPLQLVLLVALSFRIWPRYFFVDIGFVFLCVAAGIVAVGAWMAPSLKRLSQARFLTAAPVAAAVAVATLASGVLLMKNYREPKQDFAGAVATIKASMKPGDIGSSAGLAGEPMKTYFAPDWPVVENAAQLKALMQPSRRVWVLTAFASNIEQRHPDVAALLASDFELVERRIGTLGGGAIRVYRQKQR